MIKLLQLLVFALFYVVSIGALLNTKLTLHTRSLLSAASAATRVEFTASMPEIGEMEDFQCVFDRKNGELMLFHQKGVSHELMFTFVLLPTQTVVEHQFWGVQLQRVELKGCNDRADLISLRTINLHTDCDMIEHIMKRWIQWKNGDIPLTVETLQGNRVHPNFMVFNANAKLHWTEYGTAEDVLCVVDKGTGILRLYDSKYTRLHEFLIDGETVMNKVTGDGMDTPDKVQFDHIKWNNCGEYVDMTAVFAIESSEEESKRITNVFLSWQKRKLLMQQHPNAFKFIVGKPPQQVIFDKDTHMVNMYHPESLDLTLQFAFDPTCSKVVATGEGVEFQHVTIDHGESKPPETTDIPFPMDRRFISRVVAAVTDWAESQFVHTDASKLGKVPA